MKKYWDLIALFWVGISFSSLSYGFGMQCTLPTAPNPLPGVEAPFTFNCTNTGPVAYGSFSVTPTVLTAKTTTVNSVICPDDSNIAVNDTCVVTATFLSANTGTYVVNFNDQYGGDTNLDILGVEGLPITVSNDTFVDTHSPAGGATQILQALGSQGALYAVNQGQLYVNHSGSWDLLALPATVDGLTNNVLISKIYSDNSGNIYAVMTDDETIWEYNATTTVWSDTHAVSQIKHPYQIGAAIPNKHLKSSLQHSKLAVQYPEGATVTNVVADTQGNIYALIIDIDDATSVWKYSPTTGIWADTDVGDVGFINRLIADSQGHVYIVVSGDVLKYTVNSGWVTTGASEISDLGFIQGICADAYGNIYIAEFNTITSLYYVFQYNANDVTPAWVDTGAGFVQFTFFTTDSQGSIYLAFYNYNHGAYEVWKYNARGVSPSWTDTHISTAIQTISAIYGLTADSAGNVYAQIGESVSVNDVGKYNATDGWVDTNASTQTILETLPYDHSRVAYSLMADNNANVYVYTALAVSKYSGTGSWVESNAGLSLTGTTAVAPASNDLFAMTAAGIQEYTGSNIWFTSLPYSSDLLVKPIIKTVYAGSNSIVYALVSLNDSDTVEDLLQYTSGQAWVSTHFPSEANNGLLVVGAAAFNNLFYALTKDNYYVYDLWLFQSGAWSDTSLSQTGATFLQSQAGSNVVFDQSGNVYVFGVESTEHGGVNQLYQGKNNSGEWTWTKISADSVDISGTGLISDGKNNIYVTILDDSSDDAIMQYHGDGSAVTAISNPVAASTLNSMVTDSDDNLYVVTRTGTNEDNYQYDVWEYTVSANSPVWVDTGFTTDVKNANIFNLYVKNGYLYASTQAGIYIRNVGTTGTWTRLDSNPSMSLNFGSTLLYDLTQRVGVYKAALS